MRTATPGLDKSIVGREAATSSRQADSKRRVGRRRATATAVRKLALIGHPNVGKSVIFSRLTGSYVSCSNYPGTTVELYRGKANVGDETWEVVDTPGVMDLASAREDEQVTRDLLLFDGIDAVVVVVDAKNFERSQALIVQLAELGVPVVVDLNMVDESVARGLTSSVAELTQELGVPVVETVATSGQGIDALRKAVCYARVPVPNAKYGPAVEASIRLLETAISDSEAIEADVGSGDGVGAPIARMRAHSRGIATLLLGLAGDDAESLIEKLGLDPDRERTVRRLLGQLRSDAPLLGYQMAVARQQTLRGSVSLEGGRRRPAVPSHAASSVWADRLGRLSVHPVWGLVIFAGVLYGIYQFVGKLGAIVLVGWLEDVVFGTYVNPLVVAAADRWVGPPLAHDLLVGDYGLITMALTYAVALILPIVTTFFLVFGVLEDSGYFPRLTVMAHRLFRRIGLSGQAVLPMILGLSCDTMATVTTRVLETRKERVIATLLLALGVPCSAQLAVLLAMSAAVSPWVLVGVLGIAMLQILIVGRLAAILLPGRARTFITELPPLRRPQLGNVLAKTRLRLLWYVTEVLPLFVVGTLALFVLDATGFLATFQAAARPVVAGLLGLPERAADVFVMGFFRRDYGAAGLYHLQQAGSLDVLQVLVSLVVITLFVPCIANLLVIVRERGWRTAVAIVSFVLPYSLLVGGVVNFIARAFFRVA